MTLDSISQIKNKLSDIEQRRMQQQKEIADQENQRQMQLIQEQNTVKQQEVEMKQQELELAKYKIDTESQTRITVAEIDVYKLQQDLDQNNNGIPDPMEIADLGLRTQQANADAMNRQIELSEKERETSLKINAEHKKIEVQKQIENKKIDLEREKLNLEDKRMQHEKSMQVIKDKAAMAREKLKASTALKNKTSGER
jgi:hypothetical protein